MVLAHEQNKQKPSLKSSKIDPKVYNSSMSGEREELYEAEDQRAEHQFTTSLDEARFHSWLTTTQIRTLSSDERRDKMQWWLIGIDSLLSIAKRRLTGWETANILDEAHMVIEKYLYDPVVWREAQDIQKDKEKHEFFMASEMCTHEARFHRQVALITGDKEALKLSETSFKEAIELANPESSAYAMAVMEREMLKHQTGEEFDWDIFTKAYTKGVTITANAKNYDRMAALSWWYLCEALVQGKEPAKALGWQHLKEATMVQKKDVFYYPIKQLTEWATHITQRVTSWSISAEEYKIVPLSTVE